MSNKKITQAEHNALADYLDKQEKKLEQKTGKKAKKPAKNQFEKGKPAANKDKKQVIEELIAWIKAK